MMNFKGPKGHKFAESPVLKLRLPAWRSRLMALLILSCFGVTWKSRPRAAAFPTATATSWRCRRR